jgi:hypothetical protein
MPTLTEVIKPPCQSTTTTPFDQQPIHEQPIAVSKGKQPPATKQRVHALYIVKWHTSTFSQQEVPKNKDGDNQHIVSQLNSIGLASQKRVTSLVRQQPVSKHVMLQHTGTIVKVKNM